MAPSTQRRRSSFARRRGPLLLVLGGASSGKSTASLSLASPRTRSSRRKAFVATAQALDAEMAKKIEQHQRARDSSWITQEVPVDLVSWFEKEGSAYHAVVVDCITLWLSNLASQGFGEQESLTLTRDLLRAIRAISARVVLVSNELGLGIVPADEPTRRFRDVAGQVNQLLAAEADEVYLVVSGLPMRIK